MNVLNFLDPHMPTRWSVKHKTQGVEHDLGEATSHTIASTTPAIEWAFTEIGSPRTVRVSLLDQHGHVKMEIDHQAQKNPGLKGGVGHMGGVSAILKATYTDDGGAKEYRFEGTLQNVPFH